MSIPVLTFFNNESWVGKTSLIYHLAWMLSEIGHRVVACDLNPQASLTRMFLNEKRLETLWFKSNPQMAIYSAFEPLLLATGNIGQPHCEKITPELSLVVGDSRLSAVEEELSNQWGACLQNCPNAFRFTSALWHILQMAANDCHADLVLVDAAPNLGALNRAVLIATDYIIVPLGTNLLSLQGLQILGYTISHWREAWKTRRKSRIALNFFLPKGEMKPVGYTVQQPSILLTRPIRIKDKWVNRMPAEYARNLLDDEKGPYPETPSQDEKHALATVKHYRSLVPMAQEARKPIFHLTPADGAIGAHAAAARDAYTDFKILAEKIAARINLPPPSP